MTDYLRTVMCLLSTIAVTWALVQPAGLHAASELDDLDELLGASLESLMEI